MVSYRRKGLKPEEDLVILLNMTPVVRGNWKLQLTGKDSWEEVFNSDDKKYWGSGEVFNPAPETVVVDKKEKRVEINVHLPALGAVVLK